MKIRERVFRFATFTPAIFTVFSLILIAGIFITSRLMLSQQNKVRAEGVKRVADDLTGRTGSYADMIASTADVQEGAELDMRHYVKRVIDPLFKSLSVDVLTVHERDGYVLAKGHDPDKFGVNESNLPHVREALKGKPSSGIMKIDGHYTLYTTKPIFSKNVEGKAVGACTVGYILDDNFTKRIKQIVGADIVIAVGGTPLASSIDLKKTSRRRGGLKFNPRRKSLLVRNSIFHHRWFDLKYVPMISNGSSDFIGMFLAVDNTDNKRAQFLLVIVALSVIGISWVVVYKKVVRFSDDLAGPLVLAAKHAQRVAAGELDVDPLDIVREDELGDLVDSFNIMLSNLKDVVERDKKQREYLEGEVARLTEVMSAAAGGDLGARFEVHDHDAVGRVGESLNRMIVDINDMTEQEKHQRAYLERQVARLLDVMNAAARGDFSASFTVEREDEIGRLGAALNTMIADLRDMIEKDKQQRRELENKVRALLEGIDRVARGNLAHTFPTAGGDEFARIGHALNQMLADLNRKIQQIEELKSKDAEQREALERNVNEIMTAVAQAADGDLTVRLPVRGAHTINALRENLNTMLDNLMRMIARVHESAGLVETTCEGIMRNTRELERGALSQKETIQKTTESVDGMAATMATMAKHAESVMKLSGMATEEAREGGETSERAIEGMQLVEASMSDLHEVMTDLDTSAVEIEDIVKVIDEIADQTNLLALNASIEAARAGDLGRGFAVVAREVSNLAQKSVNSTREITTIVRRIQDRVRKAQDSAELGRKRVHDGSQLVHGAGSSLEGIVLAIDKVTRLIRETVNSLETQKTESAQILTAVKNVNAISEQSAAMTQKAADAVTSLFNLAKELEDMVSKFRIGN